MSLFTFFARFFLRRRENAISYFTKNPIDHQKQIFDSLIKKGTATSYGKEFDFVNIKSYEEYSAIVPVVDYEDYFKNIKMVLEGKTNIIWPSKIKWFAKSSGTTNDVSKFIPVSEESLNLNHMKAGKDLLSVYLKNNKKSKLFDGLALALGGSKQITPFDKKKQIFTGDISAILLKNLPFWASYLRTPSINIALMPEWEEKIKLMAETTAKQNITNLSGVPTWTIVLIKEVLKATGKKNILDVWPNLELFIHGAVSFKPYGNLFKDLIPTKKMNYLETYNASEGFFAFQDDPNTSAMLLLTNHGVFYEFEDINSKKITDISGVELDKDYALIISTYSGLWRYRIGDTIKFVSLKPFKILITGRTKHFINAFGEEVIIDNTDTALSIACKKLNLSFYNYSAAPIYITGKKRGAHEWIIEFIKEPKNKGQFISLLDEELRRVNSDYDAKRYKDIALKKPKIHFVKEGFFDFWLKTKKKLGGQNKIPRLSNDRVYLDSMLDHINLFQ
tara:strand:+ start:1135 stop:2646 length:1512 start_codon:yes stop_codon:yes gene_type:complete